MVKKTNDRIIITLSNEQIKWLDNQCLKLHITRSKYIRWILSRKAEEIAQYLYMQSKVRSDEEIEEIIRIAKTPWIKKDY